MPPKAAPKAAPKAENGELSETEKGVLSMAWQCFESEPKIDYDKLASLGGYTNIGSVMNIVRGAKKKLILDAVAAAGNNRQASASTSKAAQPKKRATAAKGKGKRKADDADNDDDSDALPAKKTKKTPAKSTAKKGKLASVNDEAEEDKEISDAEEDNDDDGEI
ncbi:hypothetical protein E0Z10_g9867 [Xylaria hypoxylon]|uniref:Uncharacterized protein n=1 Tax=Xylaria hypoxylon TaxID=37992 RepID=A0A4Z0YHZ5_9PEZI|nr:hypothetical protein E0Z10_g9867 [Xylaria hypoxylon]